MICLGIESTAHTFGAGIVDEKGKILANCLDSFRSRSSGIIPHQAAEHYQRIGKRIIHQTLQKAKISQKDLSLIGFSAGPGLPPCLLAGFKFASSLAKELNLPLVGINHCAAHLSIGKLLTKAEDPLYLYISGVNTQLIVEEKNRYKILGETLDLGLGNALDKFGREIGLGFPAGPEIEKLAKKGKLISLPYLVKGMDVSFSGLITYISGLYQKGYSKEDLSYSFQETAFAMVTEVAERALAYTEKEELLLVGGVAANQRLGEMLKTMAKERGARFSLCPLEYCGDNGAMIAWEAVLRFKTGNYLGEIKPYWRIDQV